MNTTKEAARAHAFDKLFFADPKKPQIRKVSVFPALAELWLKNRNKQNRRIQLRNVEFYARQMASFSWSLTNQGIGFSWDGRVTDGQTRLSAVVASGVSCDFYVSTGEDPVNRLRVDSGGKRTTEHYLQMFENFKDPKIAGTALWSLRAYGLDQRGRLTGEEVIEMAKRYRRSLEFVCRVAGKGTWRSAAVVGAIAFAYVNEPDATEQAYGDLKTGEDLHSKDSILVYRNQFAGRKIDGHDQRYDAFMKLLTAIYHRIHETRVILLKQSDEAYRHFAGNGKKNALRQISVPAHLLGVKPAAPVNGVRVIY